MLIRSIQAPNNFDLLPGKYKVAGGQLDVTLVDDAEEEILNLQHRSYSLII